MQERLTQLLPRWLPSWLRHWLAREIGELLLTGIYFYAWFGAILLYKTAVLSGAQGDGGVGLAAYALAVVKAAVIGKLALIAHAVPLGRLFGVRSPLQIALGKSITTLGMLVGLTALEEIARGLIHGHGIAATFGHFLHERLAEVAATCLLLWLVLISFYLLRAFGTATATGAPEERSQRS